MSLKWEEHIVETPHGKFRVTHWAKHDPHKLIAAIKCTAIRQDAAADPIINTYSFGPHELVTRKFSGRRKPAAHYFDILRTMADKGVSIVETPVALVQELTYGHHDLLVTLWKQKTQPLSHLLYAGGKLKVKDEARLNAMRVVAKLHAAGFSHGHLKISNFVVDEKGQTQLIDPTLVGNDPRNDGEIDYILPGELLSGYPFIFKSQLTAAVLRGHYQKWLEIYKKQFAKRSGK
ncbi:MAG: hypothetical protein V1722_01865 [Candidatus Micrarchaeota archaeon]